ncbi:MAG: acetoacetyl-CoA synthase [Spirochaetes bacterium GWB1_59_5]|nr:MAG: acetoacetyl-CoA synthase [Spirochaetes bacterium GWB1_59_5]
MLVCYNLDAPKKPTNLTINSDLLYKAKNLNINISSVLEAALADKVRQKMQSDWLEENNESIVKYNDHVSTFGLFSDELRVF